MKIALIGTYTPRQCGIGTFSKNLLDAMVFAGISTHQQPHQGIVVAINDPDATYEYPDYVKCVIQQDEHQTYLDAAAHINQSGADICILQHEFGIFGGQNGVFILSLLHRLEVPLIVTLHTVLKKPAYNELLILKEIGKISKKVVVMSETAITMLQDIYELPDEKLVLIPHGVPYLKFERQAVLEELNLADKKVILTFGFIGRNKGIETVIKALPKVVKKHPNVVYIVLGKTHPNVIKHAGEEYRVFLHRLVKKLELEDYVLFINEYATQSDLFKYLTASDIYVTPYLNESQITSGTLSYAVGVGSAVVSTPYWHAVELLDKGRGRFFGFGDDNELANVLLDILDNPEKLRELRMRAAAYGETITWQNIGGKYAELASAVAVHFDIKPYKKDPAIDPNILPPLRLDHIQRLTDDTGIYQHAIFGVPNYHEGYCLDDNARALLMAVMAYRHNKSTVALKLIPTYLSYVLFMQRDDGNFRNFMGFNRNLLDKVGSEDAFGRAIWAIGYTIAHSPYDAYFQVANKIFAKAIPQFKKLQSIRSIANTMAGLYHYLKNNPSDEEITEVMRGYAMKLVNEYRKHRTENWHWFESLLAYDNAFLPLSLLYAAEILNDGEIKQVAFESMSFLERATLKKGHLSVVGNENWYHVDEEPSQFAQQPLDALAMVLMYQQAYNYTGDAIYLNQVYTCFMWFLGENDLRISLYDFETYGCCDGLERYGVNRNQGAESTLAYIIAYLTVQRTFAKPHIKLKHHENSDIGSNSLADTTPEVRAVGTSHVNAY